MKYNLVPGTDLRISEISYGAGTAAGLMINGDHREQVRAVARAVACGINHFDTAPIYGWGASEVNLGYALKQIQEEVFVTSKFNFTLEQVNFGNLKTIIKRSVQQSLQRLQRDHLDFLLMHNAAGRSRFHQMIPLEFVPPEFFSSISLNDILGPEGVIETLNELKSEGLIRYFGISGQDNDPKALRAVISGGGIQIFNQPYNLLNPSAGFSQVRRGQPVPEHFRNAQPDFIDFDNLIEFAGSNNVGVSVISPVAVGLLTDESVRGLPAPSISQRAVRFPLEGHYERALQLAGRFKVVADRHGMTLTELAYRFVISTPGVTTVVGGFSTVEQMEQAAAYAENGPLPGSVLASLYEVWYEGVLNK